MSRYYQKPEKTRREKIGFYTAFSICLIAVCMAVYSTYTTVRQPKRQTAASVTPTSAVSVAQPMTGVTVPAATEPPETEPEVSAAPDTTAAAETTAATEPTGETRRADALQTMLAAEISLTMPTKSGRVVKPYSSDSVYNKTLNSWKPHTGADFDGELGDDVYAMLGGEQYGWRMEYFVGNEDGDFGGINVALKFDAEKGEVTAMSEEDETAAYTSHYVLTTDSGPVLSFDTYNPVLHKYGTASAEYYEGRGGDYQFFIIGYDNGIGFSRHVYPPLCVCA